MRPELQPTRGVVLLATGLWLQRTISVHALFVDLVREAGGTDPDGLARQLVLLYDGAGISAWMDSQMASAAPAGGT